MKNITTEQEFMASIADKFKAYMIEQINEGASAAYADHFDFLDACMEMFITECSED